MKSYFSRAACHRAESAMQRQSGLLENRMGKLKANLRIIDAMNHIIPWVERDPLDMDWVLRELFRIKTERGKRPEFIYANPA